MKRVIVGVIFAVLLLGGAALPAPVTAGSGADEKIAVVDFNKVMTDSYRGREAQQLLHQKDAELTRRLEAERSGLTQEQFKQKQEEYYKEFLQYQQGLETQLEFTIQQAIAQVLEEKKLSFLLDKKSVVWGGIDITNDVINKLK